MYRYKVTVSYDGSNYGGWQRQLNTNSIQETIEQALVRICAHPLSICASGRTDAGVHALAQVFHFDSTRDMPNANWQRALNSLLPRDIRIQQVERVDLRFHARFSAVSKRYDYLVTAEVNNPFWERYMAKEKTCLDIAAMQRCAAIFLGTHDFTSFTSHKIDARKSRIKTIYRLDVQAEAHGVRLIFEGNSFLRYMVRMLAQTLIEVGKHRLSEQEVRNMLAAKDKHACRYKAAAQGLYLVRVDYEN